MKFKNKTKNKIVIEFEGVGCFILFVLAGRQSFNIGRSHKTCERASRAFESGGGTSNFQNVGGKISGVCEENQPAGFLHRR